MRWVRNLLLLLLVGGATGCATTGVADPRDPLEGFNRAMYSFNEGFDTVLAKPVATAYKQLPDPVLGWVRNFFANIADLWIGVNNLIQGKPADAITDWARFAFNSTLGILGFNDVATSMGLEKHDEDLGQTLGRWGMDEGAYLVIPFWGPSSMRDGLGLIGDLYADPVWRVRPVAPRNWAIALRFTSKRADLLDASRILEEAALDKYVFLRDAYLQRRRSQVYDGNPPRAAREAPRAEAEEQPAPSAAPQSSVAPQPVAEPQASATSAPASEAQGPQHASSAAVEAAVRMLEAPAAAAAPAAAGG
jgi:phospholipid-binding lipoprotein MlaA